MRRIISSFFLFALLLSLPQLSFAQSAEALTGDAEALQFRVTPNFQLSSFQGTLLSYKWHTSPSNAYRVGASFALQSQDTQFTDDDTDPPVQSNQSIGLRGQYLTYLGGESDIEPYYGVGPQLSYSRQAQEDPAGNSVTQSTFEIGVNGAAGVEWFVWSNVSFTAEYGASLEYISEGQTNDPANGDESSASRSQWRLGGNGILFGLSAYF